MRWLAVISMLLLSAPIQAQTFEPFQIQPASGGSFDSGAILIGDIDQNGYVDVYSNGTFYMLDHQAKVIRERSADFIDPINQIPHYIGDLNGDGLDDIALSTFAEGSSYKGSVRLVFMGPDASVQSTYALDDLPGSIMSGNYPGSGHRFGFSVERIGDIDDNGVSDLAVVAPGSGQILNSVQSSFIYIFFLDESGLPLSFSEIEIDDREGTFSSDGQYLADIDDLDSDGVPDLAVGIPGNGATGGGGTGRGGIQVFFLNRDGTPKSRTFISTSTGYGNLFESGWEWGWIESIGDLDFDGNSDLVLSQGNEAGAGIRGFQVLFMNPDGSVRDSRSLTNLEGAFKHLFENSTAAGWYPQKMWDFDGDGVAEISVDYRSDITGDRGPLVLSLGKAFDAKIEISSDSDAPSRFGEEIEIQAEIRSLGSTTVSSAILNFRRAGHPTFLGLDMHRVTDGNWAASIPSFLVHEAGIEYFIVVSVQGKPDQRVPSRGVYSVPVTYESAYRYRVESGNAESGYRLISVPGSLQSGDALSILESSLGKKDPSSWRFFRARANPDDLGNTDLRIEAGQAYWLLSRHQGLLDWGDGQSISTDSIFTLVLPNGWSFFSTPFGFSVDQSLLRWSSGQTLDIRRYQGVWDTHEGPVIPQEGYAIHNTSGHADSLLIAPSLEVARLNQHFSESADKTNNAAPWAIPVNARMGRARDIDNFAVVGSSYLNRADPPPIGNYVRLAFEGEEYPLSTASKTVDGIVQTWTFNVSSEKAGTVTVLFPDLGEVPDGYAVTLVDPATGIRQDLRSDATYDVASVGAGIERTMHLEVDPQGAVDAELPTELKLHPVFPNPFSSATTIQYSLPEASNVSLEVFDVLGRRIATIGSGEKAAGNHLLVWDGRTATGVSAKSGVYFVRMNTQTSSQTISVTLTR